MNVEAFSHLFHSYAATFPQSDMIRLKIAHTGRVVENARRIMQSSAFPNAWKGAGEIAAWLHDVGRFKQFCKYQTFSDSKSINHALLSCSEILQNDWLEACSPDCRDVILKAVAYHNLKALPPDLDAHEAAVINLVRDADKLDIFTLLEQAVTSGYLAEHPEVYWGLPFTAPLSQKVAQAIESALPVDYKDIQSFADFVFIQVAWCNGGLYFPASCALTLERKCIPFRCDYLCSILPKREHETVKRCCAIAEAALVRKANHGA